MNGNYWQQIAGGSMNKERVKKLIETLREGEYSPGKWYLRQQTDLYCPMGVACAVYHKDTGLGRWKVNDMDATAEYFVAHNPHPDDYDYHIPDEVMGYYGFNSQLVRDLVYEHDMADDGLDNYNTTIRNLTELIQE